MDPVSWELGIGEHKGESQTVELTLDIETRGTISKCSGINAKNALDAAFKILSKMGDGSKIFDVFYGQRQTPLAE